MWSHTESLGHFASCGGSGGFPGSVVKNLPAVQETYVQSLGWEDPLKKEVATHSSIPAWTIPMDRGSLVGYGPWGHKESDTTAVTEPQ